MGYPTLNITQIKSNSESTNKVSDKCQIVIDVRSNFKFRDDCYKFIKSLLPLNAKIISPEEKIMVGYTSKDSRLVNLIKSIYADVETNFAEFSTDMAFFSNLNIDGIIFGPGDDDLIHKPNESIEIKQIEEYIKILINIIKNF